MIMLAQLPYGALPPYNNNIQPQLLYATGLQSGAGLQVLASPLHFPVAVMTCWTSWGLRWSSRQRRASQMVGRHSPQPGGLGGGLLASAVVTSNTSTSCLCSSRPSACLSGSQSTC